MSVRHSAHERLLSALHHDRTLLSFLTGQRAGLHEPHLAADVPQQAEHGPQSRLVGGEPGHDRPGSIGPHLDVTEPPAQLLVGHTRQRAADLQAIGQPHRGLLLSLQLKPVWVRVVGWRSTPTQDHPGWCLTSQLARVR